MMREVIVALMLGFCLASDWSVAWSAVTPTPSRPSRVAHLKPPPVTPPVVTPPDKPPAKPSVTTVTIARATLDALLLCKKRMSDAMVLVDRYINAGSIPDELDGTVESPALPALDSLTLKRWKQAMTVCIK